MDTRAAEQLARTLMVKWGLDPAEWVFTWMKTKRTLGQCCFTPEGQPNQIRLSLEFVRHNAPDIVQNTILHEIAHARSGRSHGHDATWRRWARVVGAKPERCNTRDDLVLPGGWIIWCHKCGVKVGQTFAKPNPKTWANRVHSVCKGELYFKKNTL